MFGLDFTDFTAGLGFATRTLKQLERWTGRKKKWFPAVEYTQNVKEKYDPEHVACPGSFSPTSSPRQGCCQRYITPATALCIRALKTSKDGSWHSLTRLPEGVLELLACLHTQAKCSTVHSSSVCRAREIRCGINLLSRILCK